MNTLAFSLFAIGHLAGAVQAHMGPFVKGVYALNGTVPGVDNLNSADIVAPLYQLPFDQYWRKSFVPTVLQPRLTVLS